MAVAGGVLGWKAAHTEVVFADGLRYIDQARRIDRGELVDGLLKAVDHPVYPLAIVGAHRALGGEGPEAWQRAAQLASILAGILLVVPLYLVAAALFDGASAWLACLLTLTVPLFGDVMADALSESTFLLFWTWGLWAALRFLKRGTFGWLPLTIGFGAMAYLSRPEGLLLPAALVATLALMPLLRSCRLNWPRWWAAVGFLVIGPALLVGPYVFVKGGLGTKPAIARLLGTAPKSAADAVERQRPLDPEESAVKTYAVAAKAVFEAVRDATTVPLLALAVLGLGLCRPWAERSRVWLFVAVIGGATTLALMRLHATGGYCSARHALVPALLLIAAAAAALHRLLRSIVIPGRWVGLGEGRWTPGPAVWVLALGGLIASTRRRCGRP
jgi:4-amino-4-deoxy-L-arabinose transferase-like glycosyltransferase